MSKIARLFTIDYEVYDEARRQGINLSEAAEFGIRSMIAMEDVREKAGSYSPEMQKLLGEITPEDIRKCQESVKRDILFAKGWKRAFEKNYGVEVTQKEIIKVFRGE